MTTSSDWRPGAPTAAERKCILVVEDELLIRLLVSDDLREAGYAVIEAFNADEALTILKSSVSIDLIISDVRMPGSLDGIGLLACVRETFPELPVIITSGHLEPRLALAEGANQFVPKPFTTERVLRTIHDELARVA